MRGQLVTIQDWLKYHPYFESSDIDVSYIKVANKLYAQLTQLNINELFDETGQKDELKRMSIYITCYLEDIVSELGVFEAFARIYKENNTYAVPFYGGIEPYEEGDLNLCEVKLLLWHYLMQTRGLALQTLIHPYNEALERLAEVIFEILEDEFENVYINTKYQELLEFNDDAPYTEISERLSDFGMGCYLFFFNEDEIRLRHLDVIQNFESQEDREVFAHSEYLLYLHNIPVLLNKTTKQWFAEMVKNETVKHFLRNTGRMFRGTFTLVSNESEFVHYKHIATGETIKALKSTFPDVNDIPPIAMGSFLQAEEFWIVDGFIAETDADTLSKDVSEEESMEINLTAKESNYRDLISEQKQLFENLTEGVPFLLATNRKEAELAYNVISNQDEVALSSEIKNGAIFFFNEKTGVTYTESGLEALAFSTNEHYNPEAARAKGLSILINYPENVIEHLLSNNLIPDVQINGQLGREILENEWRFLSGYLKQMNTREYRIQLDA